MWQKTFWIHFTVWKYLYFDLNFAEVCHKGSYWQWVCIGAGNCRIPNRRQAITRNTVANFLSGQQRRKQQRSSSLAISKGNPMPWWRHQMETFFVLLALCAGNSPVTGEFPSQRPVTRSFDVFFDLRMNIRLNKQPWGWWFDMPSCWLWRHCNVKGQWCGRRVHAMTPWYYDIMSISY